MPATTRSRLLFSLKNRLHSQSRRQSDRLRGGQSLKLSTKNAVFKRVSLLIGGQACRLEDQTPLGAGSVHNVGFWQTSNYTFRLRIAPTILRTLMVQAAFLKKFVVQLGLSKNLMRHDPQNISIFFALHCLSSFSVCSTVWIYFRLLCGKF